MENFSENDNFNQLLVTRYNQQQFNQQQLQVKSTLKLKLKTRIF